MVTLQMIMDDTIKYGTEINERNKRAGENRERKMCLKNSTRNRTFKVYLGRLKKHTVTLR